MGRYLDEVAKRWTARVAFYKLKKVEINELSCKIDGQVKRNARKLTDRSRAVSSKELAIGSEGWLGTGLN